MDNTFFEISYMVMAAGLLAWVATISKQPVIIAYILGGLLIGPGGFGWVEQVELIDSISHIGITLLLFLAGMVLHPQRLVKLFREAAVVTLIGCLLSFGIMFGLARLYGFSSQDSLLAGTALMFSSTVLVVKLLPTTSLHQKRMGSMCIAVLIMQDLVAVTVLVLMGGSPDSGLLSNLIILPIKAVLLIVIAVVLEQFVIRKMMRQCDVYYEILYMLCLGWCLGMAVFAKKLGLSPEVGAFIAGVCLARSPVSRFLSEQLQPIRDFFLMFFFFVLGARLNVFMETSLWLFTIAAAVIMGGLKSFGHWMLFKWIGEKTAFAKETGIRLGQGSEFGLIILLTAERLGYLTDMTSQVVQLVIIITMVLSSYVVVFSFPTPLGARGVLKQD